MSFCVVWIDFYCFAVGGDGSVQVSLRSESIAQIDVGT